jgi:hypothetical protein
MATTKWQALQVLRQHYPSDIAACLRSICKLSLQGLLQMLSASVVMPASCDTAA